MSELSLSAPSAIFATYGRGFAVTLASMFSLSDEGHAACPEDWRDLTAMLHTLIEDERLTTSAVAQIVDLPEQFVADYRAIVGI